jgi:microcystin-dependent protein
MADIVGQLADQIGDAEPAVFLRIAVVTAIESSGSRRLQTDQTDTAWLNRDKDSTFQVGDRVWLLKQGSIFLVGGRLSGEPSGTPIGTILAYAGSTPPPGWMAADGSAISRTTYAKLLAVTGLGYGVGDGSTTFNLPDLGARFPMGAKGLAPLQTSTGGAATVALSTANLPAHDHSSAGNHAHGLTNIGGVFVTTGGGTAALASTAATWVTDAGGTHTHSSVGSGTAHENLPPYLAILYIIRAL